MTRTDTSDPNPNPNRNPNPNDNPIHGRRSSVNFWGKTFLPENYVWKIKKTPEFNTIFSRKLTKFGNSGILHDICPKMSAFHMIIVWIIFPDFVFFWGGETRGKHVPPASPSAVSYAYAHRSDAAFGRTDGGWYTGWAKKVNPKYSTHNFVKCWPI